jgi:hypothetical protein
MALFAVTNAEVCVVRYQSDLVQTVRVVSRLRVADLRAVLSNKFNASSRYLVFKWDGTIHSDHETIENAGEITCAIQAVGSRPNVQLTAVSAAPSISLTPELSPVESPVFSSDGDEQPEPRPFEGVKKPPDYYQNLNELERQSNRTRIECIWCYNFHDYDFNRALDDLKRE